MLPLVLNLAYIKYPLCQICSVYMQHLRFAKAPMSKRKLTFVITHGELTLSSWCWWVVIHGVHYGDRLVTHGVHYDDVIMGAMASRITSLTIVYSTVYSDAHQRKHQSSASLAFVWEIHRGPVNSPHKWPVTRKMFPFHDVIMSWQKRRVWCEEAAILLWQISQSWDAIAIFTITYTRAHI